MASSDISDRIPRVPRGPCPGPRQLRKPAEAVMGAARPPGLEGVEWGYHLLSYLPSSSLLGMKVANCPGPARGAASTPWGGQAGEKGRRKARAAAALRPSPVFFCSSRIAKSTRSWRPKRGGLALHPRKVKSPGLLSPFCPPRSLGGATPCQLCTCRSAITRGVSLPIASWTSMKFLVEQKAGKVI